MDVSAEIGETDFDMFFDRGEMFEPVEEPDPMDVEGEALVEVPVGLKEGISEYEALPVIWGGEVRLFIHPSNSGADPFVW